MRILSMTATFGKLENQTLKLQPGLNVIHAPNEWGKSTWCAFLAIMLYGLETRVKTTKTALADKERYAPWSGSPMSGSMDIEWNGRIITIQRWTKGRTPMGEFKAFETETGLPVPELTALNCGQTLLGVERSVFMRAGFLRLSDLPVTQDESLRRRLNALVTTGDESNAGDLLAQKLKDLKNKCRYNRSGLLPQAEAQRAELESKLSELLSLQKQSERILQRQQEMEAHIAALENHKTALKYAAAEENLHRVAAAQEAAVTAARQVEILESACADLPDRDAAQQTLEKLLSLQQAQQLAQMDAQMLPQPPQAPNAPLCFYGLDGSKAVDQVNTDIADYHALIAPGKKQFPLWIFAILAAVAGAGLLIMELMVPGLIVLVAGIVLAAVQMVQIGNRKKVHASRQAKAETIRARYGGGDPADWLAIAQLYAQQRETYETALAEYAAQRQQLEQRLVRLNAAIGEAAEGLSLPGAIDHWQSALRQMDALDDARREQQRAENHAEAIKAVAKPAEKPTMPDSLTFTEPETARLLSDAYFEQKQLQIRLGQCQGRMETLGSEDALQTQLQAVDDRIRRLSDTYAALELAQQHLAEATAELQRRFAPRIAKQAQSLFTQLTGGRYDRLTLSEDLSVNASAADETVLRAAMWRSEGTVDQLYLALRLAVAGELTPDAPLILDDALVRFDDTRHAAAMQILRQTAQSKQILLFTCQSREMETK